MRVNRLEGPSLASFIFKQPPPPRLIQSSKKSKIFFYREESASLVIVQVIWGVGFGKASNKALPYLMLEMMKRGSKKRGLVAIARGFEKYGAEIHFRGGRDALLFELKVLSAHFSDVWPLFLEILSEPEFEEKSLENLKKKSISALKQEEAQPAFLAKKMLRKGIFGGEHPYGYTLDVDDILAISCEDLRKYFAEVSWKNPFVVLSGEIASHDGATLVRDIEHLSLRLADESFWEKNQGEKKIKTTHPNSLQDSIALGATTIQQNDPDYPKLVVANTLLGNFFSSRLMQNIREKKGYTYGIYSQLVPFKGATLWMIASDLKVGKAEESILAVHKEIERLKSELAPIQEIEILKNYLKGQLISSFDSVFSLGYLYVNLHIHSLDMGYYHRLYSAIDSTTPFSIQATASKYFENQGLHEVVVAPLKAST